MGRMMVKVDITPNYMAAAERMLEKLGLKIGAVSSPQELQQKLISKMNGKLKDPNVKERGEFTVVRDGEASRLIFMENGDVAVFSPTGRESFLFTGSDGAGFIEYGLVPKHGTSVPYKEYLFYSDLNGEIEREGGAAASLSNEAPRGTVLSALAALERIEGEAFRKHVALGAILAGVSLK